MKKTSKIILLALISGVTIFSGCKKEGGMNSITMSASQKAAAGESGKETAVNAISTLSYQLLANPSTQQSPVQWLKAQAAVSEILFNSGSIAQARPVAPPANGLAPISTAVSAQGQDQLNYSKQVNVAAPLFSITNLGTLDIKTAQYLNAIISVKLSPVNGPALVLGGTYNKGNSNALINIDLTVDNEVLLAASMSNMLPVTARQYKALLVFSIDQVMNGIDLANAEIINNTLSISVNSNPAIYQAVLTNLKDMPVGVEFVALTPSTNDPISKSVATSR